MRINFKKKEFKKRVKRILLMSSIVVLGVSCASDSSDDDEKTSSALESPYLICASRNPGGVGFDFVSDRSGVAYDLDKIPDLEYDLKIKSVKAYKNVKGEVLKKGAPYAELYGTSTDNTANAAEAVRVTGITGITGYGTIATAGMAQSYTYGLDTKNFSKTGLDASSDGFLIYDKVGSTTDVKGQMAELAIGEKWISTAKNATADNEAVWLIKTREGQYVKLIFTEFPASGAATSTGYVAIKWELLE